MDDEIRIDTILQQAKHRLCKASESPALDAGLLLTQALDVPRSYLFAHPEETLDAVTVERYLSAIARREKGEPLAYIVGEKEFWSISLMVSPDTLIPRPETEVLVQEALNLIPRTDAFEVLDLGTGCGAIALAIASERPQARITATDVSTAALGIARENARQLDLINLEFVEGSWCDPVRQRAFDLLVSNPPYIRANDEAMNFLRFEPESALVSGDDGLVAIRVLAADCPAILKLGGTLLVEHGAEQLQDVAAILTDSGWSDIRCICDLAGLPRVTAAIFATFVDDSSGEGS